MEKEEAISKDRGDNMTDALISVIIPVYKVEAYLDECIQSVVDQTYSNLEIILVDDGSPDRCPEICDEWAKRDPRILVIHKKNGGLSSARNAGIQSARGEYIGFIDSDDYIHPEMYERLLTIMKGSTRKVASCSFARVWSNDEIKPEESVSPIVELSLTEALNKVFYGEINESACCKLFARSMFASVRFPEGEVNEDVCVIIPIFALSGGIVHIRDELYYYRVRENSITHSYWKTDADVVLKHLNLMQNQLLDIRINNFASFNLYLGKSAYSTALYLDKNYYRITPKAKENQKKYIAIMRKKWLGVIFSKYVNIKDKILYSMVATRTLRPIYKLLRKQ